MAQNRRTDTEGLRQKDRDRRTDTEGLRQKDRYRRTETEGKRQGLRAELQSNFSLNVNLFLFIFRHFLLVAVITFESS